MKRIDKQENYDEIRDLKENIITNITNIVIV